MGRELLLDRPTLSLHAPWIAVAALAALAGAAWYALESQAEPTSTFLVGLDRCRLVLGAAAGAIILFELALWPRKALRRVRILGRARTWMLAHIWLGLLTVPLIVLHARIGFGGPLSAATMTLFLAVIASGLLGLVLQQTLPRRLIEAVPGETVASQIDRVAALYATEADDLVAAACGRAARVESEDWAAHTGGAPRARPDGALSASRAVGLQIVGARRTALPLLSCELPDAPIATAGALEEAFRKEIRPFLADGPRTASAVGSPEGSTQTFERLRDAVGPAGLDVVAALEEACAVRRQLDRQARLQWWLHAWLTVHLPASVVMVSLMLVHAYLALLYH